MTRKPSPEAVHFPTSKEHGPIPFPTARTMAQRALARLDQSGLDQPDAEELRLMADTMPGDGPGD